MVIPHHISLSGPENLQTVAANLLLQRDAQNNSVALSRLKPVPAALIDRRGNEKALRHASALLDAEKGDYTALYELDAWRPALLQCELLSSEVMIDSEVLGMPELISRIRTNLKDHGAVTRQEWITRNYGAVPLTVRRLPQQTPEAVTELACESLGHPILPGLRLLSQAFGDLTITAACLQEDQGTAGEFFLSRGEVLAGSAEYCLELPYAQALKARCLDALRRSDCAGEPRPGVRPSASSPHSPQSPFFSAWTRQSGTRQPVATPAGAC